MNWTSFGASFSIACGRRRGEEWGRRGVKNQKENGGTEGGRVSWCSCVGDRAACAPPCLSALNRSRVSDKYKVKSGLTQKEVALKIL